MGDVIMECEFFPSIEWFKTFVQNEKVIIEQYEYFVRTSYRNRAYIAGPNDVICLSVPLEKGRNQKSLMKDIKVCASEDWQVLHWKTITSCYRRSPFFEYFEAELEAFYKKKYTYLMDVNLDSIALLKNILDISTRYTLSKEYKVDYEQDYRKAFLPKNRLSAIQEEYIQPFSDKNGFEKNLSMLDYIFCCGRWN